ncbi:MAG: phospho-N-acetylmuramoyl-pentapeptide-transferase, partial [Sedimentisphaerales bacterium]|nr:phospho-N-acetylmuramoyl-pentapeptide-transferase [Sedimentisphaerales bacterium]
MIYLILEHYLKDFMFNTLGFYSWEEVLLRSLLSMLTSLLLCLWLGPKVIRWLKKKKIGDIPNFDHEILNQKNSHKDSTPTMGGILILISIIVSTLLWADLTNQFVIKGLFVMVWLGLLGGVDDWLKLTKSSQVRNRHGLLSWEKMMYQIGLGALVG